MSKSNEPFTDRSPNSPRIGVPSEARLNDQRQIENEEVSRRYSTIVPIHSIRAEGQFLQKASGRPWSGVVIAGLWLMVGLPLIGMLAACIVNAHGTIAERLWRIAAMCFFPGIPLLALAAMTWNWWSRRKA